jgi:hypothetical protein
MIWVLSAAVAALLAAIAWRAWQRSREQRSLAEAIRRVADGEAPAESLPVPGGGLAGVADAVRRLAESDAMQRPAMAFGAVHCLAAT